MYTVYVYSIMYVQCTYVHMYIAIALKSKIQHVATYYMYVCMFAII